MTIRTIAIAIPVVVLGWLTTLAVVALATDEAPAYVVLFPSDSFVRSLPDRAAIISTSAFSITLRSGETGFARSLYGSGARIVLPAGLRGCLPLPKDN
jgi:hypothetical protein